MSSTKNFITERDALARRLAVDFDDPNLLTLALTHKSAGQQRAPGTSAAPTISTNNERLEFLGDAVLGAVIANRLYALHPNHAEDGLSLLRASLVNRDALAAIARDLEMGRALLLGEGELRSGGHNRSSILADALEAVIGARFLDAGYEAATELILRLFSASLASAVVTKDPKTRLQEWLQARGSKLPIYEVEEITGADHARQYQVCCRLTDESLSARGIASSRRAAEQAAATQVLEGLDAQTAMNASDQK